MIIKAIQVKGNIQSLQSNVDFSRKIMSTGDSKSVDALRRHFFDIFIEEDIERHKRAKSVVEEELEFQQEDMNEEEEQEEIKASPLSFLSSVQKLHQASINRVVVEDTYIKDNKQALDSVKDGYTEHGTYLEDLDDVESKQIKESKQGSEYSDHGVYIEDLVFSENTENPVKEDSVEYSDHGTYIEDLVFSEKQEVKDNDIEDSINADEEDNTWDEFIENEDDDLWREFDKGERVNDNVEESLEEDNPEDDNIWGAFDEEKPEEVIPKEPAIVEKEIARSEKEKVEVPREIRDFLKKHPGSTVAFVEQYYPRKEIEKGIKLGRIYKKKGKLFI